MTYLGEKLGPFLIQLPPHFTNDHFDALQDFIRQLPQTFHYAIEFRNHSLLSEHVYSLLRDHSIALVLADRPRYPQIDCVTATFVYVRWEGDRRIVSGDSGRVERDRSQGLAKWAQLLHNYKQKELNIYGYFSKYYSGYPPADIDQITKLLI
jgi:uncharacterized protein YecE (DUF72 family)